MVIISIATSHFIRSMANPFNYVISLILASGLARQSCELVLGSAGTMWVIPVAMSLAGAAGYMLTGIHESAKEREEN